jgi:arylsulfatase A-like enzyme
MRDRVVVQQQPDLAALEERYVDEALGFIRAHAGGPAPFFLYLAHMYVHLPLYAPAPYVARSQNGRYGACVEHLDWTVAALMAELRRLGLDQDTVVVFTSDNGSRVRDEGGSNGALRGTKASTWEGGSRVPCIVRWPGVVPAGSVSDGLMSGVDLLPSLLACAGVVPDGRLPIDGVDCLPFWRQPAGGSPRDSLCYFHHGCLAAVRHGVWKLHLRRDGQAVSELYDVVADVGETRDRAADEPVVLAQLQSLAEQWRRRLGDQALGISGSEVRPIGRVAQGVPLTAFDASHPYFLAEYDLGEAG